MTKIRTAKEIFDEELSGEPLCQDAIINAIEIAQKEMYYSFHKMFMALFFMKHDKFNRKL